MSESKTLPLLFKVAGERCTIVGHDSLAEDWAVYLSKNGLETHLIHPSPQEGELKDRSQPALLKLSRREFETRDIEDCGWLLVTYSEYKRCEELSQLARRRHVWAAFLRYPELGNVVLPQTFDLASLQVLFPLATPSPKIHERLSKAWRHFLPLEFSKMLELVHSVERRMTDQIPDRQNRIRAIDSLMESHFAELIGQARWEGARQLAEKVIQSYAENPARRSRISPRIGVQTSVTFESTGHPYSGKLFNLSRDGAFIATKSIFPKLTHVTSIEFVLPNNVRIKGAEGFVVWDNQPVDPRAPIFPPGFALMFDSLSAENLTHIEDYVRSQLK